MGVRHKKFARPCSRVILSGESNLDKSKMSCRSKVGNTIAVSSHDTYKVD